ncbi:MarR family winged helix-turn-helix transcriptional regulator [Micromonospora inyonensis]|uniref:DNA-binding transcriptional regulator, MarR family n=1 Tax=Micromonospora inyonensis TaxID=47866 RepID=A0A1C6RJI9_9ACTN|nr:MarR family transcriptional regulator [Micromonospora inyonensis]SCL17213.1 DNA-binding transcriptional regulator, MarR family [Micromonospora inyonensis]
MTEPRWLDEQESRMWRAYLRMHRAVEVAVDRQLSEAGISRPDYEVLVPLSEAEGRTMRVRNLAIWLGWNRSRIAHQLRRMEQRGLITRFECSADARGTMVRLTDQGYAAVVAAAPGHVETVRNVLVDQLDQDEIAQLTAIAERVVAAAGWCQLPHSGTVHGC